MECVNCGCINSGAWTYDGVGNYLCGYCQYRKNRLFQLAVSTPVSNISNIPGTATRDCIVQPVKRPKRILAHPSSRSGTICSNCKTSQTSLWRRAPEGDVVCNACGLYRKMHGRQRPLTMRRDLIQTRKRRCAKKHLSSSNHLQQQQQQQWHEPRLESIDGQAHSSIIKRQYLAASNPYAYFPSRTVKTEPYVMPGKVPHFDLGRNVCQFDKSWNNIPAKVPQPF
ncbi:Erythroid transcription factor [Echinococcus granulosus]|uniref:GATA transcription factor alpha n=1 Tax=Echinococcus granulosus TaxID=6210 RepID=A0A068WEV0_ECHGR|nr:Erythroid transcription factor [Echinococcus granulosus]CDS16956.1 GATA transcription factor alpha [Echinococcus granulosus]